MKFSIKILGLIVLLLFCGMKLSIGQDFPVPEELVYYPPVDSSQFWETYRLPDKLYPVGWSKDGKLAYFVEPEGEACGCYFLDFIIQDLTDNQIVWQWKYNGDDSTNVSGYEDENLTSMIKKYSTVFNEKIDEYQIQTDLDFKLQSFPMIKNDEKYHVSLITTSHLDADWGDLELFDEAKIRLYQKNGDFDQIISSHEQPEYAMTLDMKIVGYFASPDEQYFVVFYVEEHRGWEGPPNVLRFRLVGLFIK